METNGVNFKDLVRIYDGKDSVSIVIIHDYCRCAIDCSIVDGEVILNRLIVHEKLRRKGISKLLMEELCNYLDRKKFNCVLGVESDDPLGMNDDLLVEFYKQYGFESTTESKYFMKRYS